MSTNDPKDTPFAAAQDALHAMMEHALDNGLEPGDLLGLLIAEAANGAVCIGLSSAQFRFNTDLAYGLFSSQPRGGTWTEKKSTH